MESNTTGTGKDFAESARRHGLRPVLLARSPARYPYAAELGLDTREVDTCCAATVTAVCRQLMPTGLAGVTSSSEYFMHTAASVAAELGLPGPDPAAVARCRDKATQRQWLASHGVPVPDFAVCQTRVQAHDAAWTMASPVVVKPLRGSGSEGVRACADPYTAASWAEHLLAGDDIDKVLVEREISGPEFSVELVDGEVAGITAKHLGAKPYFVETGHDFPAPVAVHVAERLGSVARDSVHALGLTTGPAHMELRLEDSGDPYVIEVNPRLAGGLIPRLVRHATGRDLVGEVVAGLSGRPVRPVGTGDRYASIRFLVPPRSGVVRAVTGLDLARELPGVVETSCAATAGTTIHIGHSFADRKGYVIALSGDGETAGKIADRAVAAIAIEYLPPGSDHSADHRTTQ
ncbi:biotin carboxylase [Kibdelosporangium banguiense]|uniref:Biotin carboxylase n=1 Tax=Kibdelosporangium banguiense TaxID=1365924 RepID=A0ABS4TX23_9PSEU|nr:ATP-grasp domain-containing protein [Kibdelosporangium banguiense]MBP2328539.1 biotin carboxylase [Kibdelosporangium banguiense]